VVRLLWRAVAPGLRPLRLPRVHLLHPRVNTTKQHLAVPDVIGMLAVWIQNPPKKKPFDSAGRFRATLLLRNTCMRSCCTWIAICVAV